MTDDVDKLGSPDKSVSVSADSEDFEAEIGGVGLTIERPDFVVDSITKKMPSRCILIPLEMN